MTDFTLNFNEIAAKYSLQLPLDLLHEELTFNNFVITDTDDNNKLVLASLKAAVSDIENYNLLYLWGAVEGVGLTHLLHACKHLAHTLQQTAVYFSASYLSQYPPELLLDLEDIQLLCLDNIELLLGKRQWEEVLFTLINSTKDNGANLIISARQSAHNLNCIIPDLKTRLTAGLTLKVNDLDDESKMKMLITHAQARGFILDTAVAKFMLSHCQRDNHSLTKLLSLLDTLSLSKHKKVTINLVKEIL